MPCVIFQDSNTEAVLLVNAINHIADLHIISDICPSLARILINTQRTPVRLFINGAGEISSTEGTTQGDSLATSMYICSCNCSTGCIICKPNTFDIWAICLMRRVRDLGMN